MLLRIDNSFSRAELEQNITELDAKRLTLARLDAEAKGAASFAIDADVEKRLPELLAKEQQLFRAGSILSVRRSR